MLDLLKVARQMQSMSQQLAREAKQLAGRLDLAVAIATAAAERQAELCDRRSVWEERLAFACAAPLEPLSTTRAIAPLTAPHTVVATDGSQIDPNRHEIAYCYLLNIGRVALHYGCGLYPLLDSTPEICYKGEDLQSARQWGIPLGEWMGWRRTVAEMTALATLAIAQRQPKLPIVAMTDGALLFWGLEAFPPEARDRILPEILAAWDALEQARIPLVGYISAPRSVEATNFLRLQSCPFDTPNCTTHCTDIPADTTPCARLHPLRDATLWQRWLQPGARGALWQSGARIVREYGDRGVVFCYLHAGAEIARVEMPRWVAADEELLERSLAAVLAQVQKGYGYPVALAEAHNQAVVTAGDRRRFFALLERELMQAGLPNVATSTKEARKRSSIA